MIRCKSCKEPIVWLDTKNGKKMPVNAQTVEPGTTKYLIDAGQVPHWMTCPYAKKHQADRPAAAPKRSPEELGQLSLLEPGLAQPTGVVTDERAAQLRNFLSENGIRGGEFSIIRKAAGYTTDPATWDEETYHAVYGLAIATATCLQAALAGYPSYLEVQGRSPEEVAAARAEFDRLMSTRRAS